MGGDGSAKGEEFLDGGGGSDAANVADKDCTIAGLGGWVRG